MRKAQGSTHRTRAAQRAQGRARVIVRPDRRCLIQRVYGGEACQALSGQGPCFVYFQNRKLCKGERYPLQVLVGSLEVPALFSHVWNGHVCPDVCTQFSLEQAPVRHLDLGFWSSRTRACGACVCQVLRCRHIRMYLDGDASETTMQAIWSFCRRSMKTQ